MTYHVLALSFATGLTVEAEDTGGAFTATLGTGPFYVLGDGSSSDLVQELEDQLNASGADAWTVTLSTGPSVDADPVITVACNDTFDLDSGTLDISDLGLTAKGSVNGTSMTGVGVPSLFVPDAGILRFETINEGTGSQEVTVSNQVWNYARSEVAKNKDVAWEWISEGRKEDLEEFWALSRKGRAFQVRFGALASYPGALSGTYHFDNIRTFAPTRLRVGVAYYSVAFKFLEQP